LSFRLEPSPFASGIEEGLAARVHDALWMLARQWQVGEFNGKDAGTPVIVQATGSASPVNAWRGLNQADWKPLDGSADPLDALVELEDESEPSLRERVEAGAHFLRLLAAAGLRKLAAAFVAAHMFDLDPTLPDGSAFEADPLFAAIARRTPDGLLLHSTALALAEGQPQPIPIDPGDLASLVAVSNEWLVWYREEIKTETGAGTAITWQEHRLEYGFAVSSQASGAGAVLVADRYQGDGLDWFDFDIDPELAAAPAAAPLPIDVKAIPNPIRFAGMPLPRFWEMEDARCDFGSIDAAPNDIGRLLLVEFATVYGNDWFVLPLKIPAGTLTVLDSVTVTDVFGRTFVLDRAGQDDADWNMFSLDTRGKAHAAQNGLLCRPLRDDSWKAPRWKLYFSCGMRWRIWRGGWKRVFRTLSRQVWTAAPHGLPPANSRRARGTCLLITWRPSFPITGSPWLPSRTNSPFICVWCLWRWTTMVYRRKSSQRVCCCAPPIQRASSGYGSLRKRSHARVLKSIVSTATHAGRMAALQCGLRDDPGRPGRGIERVTFRCA
jgi:hypothetical protein